MDIAKIIRHRHKYHHFMNDDLKTVTEETHFKIVFSDPVEMAIFQKWCIKNKGKYDYDKVASCQKGKMPKLKLFKDEICWCDIMTYYLLHVSNYKYHSSLHPYKGEIYFRE
ncbi:MAG: hypothetical protein SH856_03835 [Flavobacteriales bacterium]|nr:hypothetical protein [Flavobacteriales bacterium]